MVFGDVGTLVELFSGSTGPSAAHSGSDYLFFESSTGGLDTAIAVTPMH